MLQAWDTMTWLLCDDLSSIMAAAVHEGLISCSEGICDALDCMVSPEVASESPQIRWRQGRPERQWFPTKVLEAYMKQSTAGMSHLGSSFVT